MQLKDKQSDDIVYYRFDDSFVNSLWTVVGDILKRQGSCMWINILCMRKMLIIVNTTCLILLCLMCLEPVGNALMFP